MTDTTEVAAIRAAMRLFESATCTTEIEAALDAFELASGQEEVSRLIKHIDAQQAEIERLKADRHVMQATGDHPAPCAMHCEAQAYQVEIRALRKVIGLLDSALKEAFPYGAEGVVFERWNAARMIEKGSA